MPTHYLQSRLEPENHDIIDNLHDVNQLLPLRSREDTEATVPQRPSRSQRETMLDEADLPLHSTYTRYDGLDEECPICQSKFERGGAVCRLTCRHLYHTFCHREHCRTTRQTRQGAQATCPCGHGGGDVVALFRFNDSVAGSGGLAVVSLPLAAEVKPQLAATSSRDHSVESFRSAGDPTDMFPSWTTQPDNITTCQDCLPAAQEDNSSLKSRDTTRVMKLTVPSVTDTGARPPITPGPSSCTNSWPPSTVRTPPEPAAPKHLASLLDDHAKSNTTHSHQSGLAEEGTVLHTETLNTPPSGLTTITESTTNICRHFDICDGNDTDADGGPLDDDHDINSVNDSDRTILSSDFLRASGIGDPAVVLLQ